MAQVGSIVEWHTKARPAPDPKALSIQIGCHLEEVAEMLVSLQFISEDSPSRAMLAKRLSHMVNDVASDLKSGVIMAYANRKEDLLDSLCDQIVTAVGVGVCAGMKMEAALDEVTRSNWSKFVDGEPVFNEHGKIAKGPGYTPPDLDGMY